MKALIQKVKSLAHHQRASYWLFALSFSEAIFFPVPPDVLLVPLSMLNRSKALRFAFIATVSSVLGGIIGFFIGWYSIHLVEQLLFFFSVDFDFNSAKSLFEKYGVLTILIASLTPIPYKVFTIAAGLFSFSLPLFIVAALIGRGLRFYSEVIFIIVCQESQRADIAKYANWLAIPLLFLVLAVYWVL
jgi:membrane protein YqaA with SNARE-associated domain